MIVSQEVALTFGLVIHPEKTKILTNATKKTGRGIARSAVVHDMSVQILPSDGSVKYLGHKLSFDDYQGTELRNRIRAGWAKFMANKQELTSKTYTLNDRLRLFDAVVSPTVLYASGARALTKEQERSIQGTQRKMLRMILGAGRRPQPLDPSSIHEDFDVDSDVDIATDEEAISLTEDELLEPWVDWIRRVTHRIEEQASKLNIQSWGFRARGNKWDLVSKICNHSRSRWPHRLLN